MYMNMGVEGKGEKEDGVAKKKKLKKKTQEMRTYRGMKENRSTRIE